MSARVKRPTGPFAGLYDRSDLCDNTGLVVVGSACAVGEDKHAHASVELCLVHHPQDSQLVLDRFDGRNLLGLEEINAAEAERGSKPGEAADLHSLEPGLTLAELNSERYGDLDPSCEHLLEDPYGFAEFIATRRNQDELQEREQSPVYSSEPHKGPAFAFDYTTVQPSRQLQRAAAGERQSVPPPLLSLHTTNTEHQDSRDAFEPPFECMPPSLAGHLPPTERLHQIISQTAKFVRTNGTRVEVLLRVKHGGNPNFAFLIPEDRLFPYYRWLVDEGPQELPRDQPVTAPTSPSAGAAAAAGSPDGEQQGVGSQQIGSGQRQEAAITTAAEPGSPAACGAGGMGALDLLRAYSMASEQESEHEGAESRQQALCHSGAAPADGAENMQVDADNAAAVYGAEHLPAQGSSSPDASVAGTLCQAAVGSVGAADSQVDTNKQTATVGPAPATDAAAGVVEEVTAAAYGAISPAEVAAQAPATATAGLSAGEADAAASGTGESDPAEPAAPGTEAQLPDEPPAQLKGIIDKLVAFVKKNGIRFEMVVRSRECSNPHFGFLQPWHAHHAYYRSQLERAMGTEPVALLFKEMQAAEDNVTKGSGNQEAVTATEGSKQAQKLVALKANPRLVLAHKRTTSATAAATQRQVAPVGGRAVDEDSALHSHKEAEHNHCAIAADETAPGAGTDASAAAVATAAATATAASLVAAATARAVVTAAAAAPVPEDHAAAVLAKKRLKLRVYLKQKRAEQLAEQEQQEQEKKARAILAHRMLLKRLAAGEGEAAERNEDGHEHEQLQSTPVPLPAAASVPVQLTEVEEGEIEETDDIDEIAEGCPTDGGAEEMAAATAVETERSEVQQLLQLQEPVSTTLPGLKELAASAAAAAAKHRAALLAGSDDEDAAGTKEPAGSTAALATALKAKLAALNKSKFDTWPPAPTAAAEGAAAHARNAASAAVSTAATTPGAAAQCSMAGNMVAAANAAAAAIAAQAAGVPAAACMLPVPASLPLQLQPQLQLRPIVRAVAAPGNGLAAALAAAAASAAAAAAVQPKSLGQREVTISGSTTASSSKSRPYSSDGGESQPRQSRPARRCTSRSSSSRSKSPSKLSGSPMRSCSSSPEASPRRPRSRPPAKAHSKPPARLRRGDSAPRKRSRSRSRSVRRHHSSCNKRRSSRSRSRHGHKDASRKHRRHKKRERSQHRSSSSAETRQRSKLNTKERRSNSGKHHCSSRHISQHKRKKRRERSRSSSPSRRSSSSTSGSSTSSSSSSSSGHGGCISEPSSRRSTIPAPAVQRASAAGTSTVPGTVAAVPIPSVSSKQAAAGQTTATAGRLPPVPVDNDKLRQRLRQMLGKLQK